MNSELQPGAYPLPNNCRAFVRNGKVIVYHKCGVDNIPRCRDCRFNILGKSRYNQRYPSPVCEKQPKTNKGYANHEVKQQQRFYSVRPCDAACELFAPKQEEKL